MSAVGKLVGKMYNSDTMGTKAKRAQAYTINRESFQQNEEDKEVINREINRQKAQANVATGGSNEKQLREGQLSLADSLRQRAEGKKDSVAQQQFQRATDKNLAQQLAAARSGRVTAANKRQLNQQGAETRQQAAGQLGQLRAAETATAEHQLGNVLQGTRSQDANAILRAIQTQANMLDKQIGMTEQDRQANILSEQLAVQNALGVEGINSANQQAAMKGKQGLTSGILGAGSAIGAAAVGAPSDEKIKKNINKGEDKDLEKFKEAIKNYGSNTFDYKDEDKFGDGKHAGMMAQDLEKSGEIGKSMVNDTPEGKIVDFGKQMNAYTSIMSDILKKQEELEKRMKK